MIGWISSSEDTYHCSFLLHVLNKDDLTYLCLTNGNTDDTIAFAFLFDVQAKFTSKFHRSVWSDAPSFSMNADFSATLANSMVTT